MTRRSLPIVLAAVLFTLAPPPAPGARAAAGFRPCGQASPVLCTTVAVPFDRSGRLAGTVELHVEALPPAGTSRFDPRRKVVFMVAGGPGQGSADTFDLADYGDYWRSIFPGYTIVGFDDRGTGRSGELRCRGLAAVINAGIEQTARIVGSCGRLLGARGSVYSTRTNADDTEAVRRRLGVDRITLYGVSYGSKQAFAYALRHPAHVERLVLDSVEPPDTVDSFSSDSLRAIPGSLRSLCQGTACRGLAPIAPAFALLANRLAVKPLVGSIARPGSRPVPVRVDGLELIDLALDSDLNPGLAAELPAAISSALRGQQQPLVRLAGLDTLWGSSLFSGINLAVNVATECNDGSGGFPWPATTAIGKRQPLLRAAIAALPGGSSGPFGNWAASNGLAAECSDWPRPSANVELGSGRPPNVPVLILSGDRDIRTPTQGARRLLTRFPRGRLLVVHGSGHDVLDSSPCAQRFVTGWLAGRRHGSCPRLQPVLAPLKAVPVFPGPLPLSAAATLRAAAATLDEAEAAWLATQGISRSLPGPGGGTLTPRSDQVSFALAHYSAVPGVTLGGLITYDPAARAPWSGSITVAGRRAAAGTLAAGASGLTGTLGGRPVAAPLGQP